MNVRHGPRGAKSAPKTPRPKMVLDPGHGIRASGAAGFWRDWFPFTRGQWGCVALSAAVIVWHVPDVNAFPMLNDWYSPRPGEAWFLAAAGAWIAIFALKIGERTIGVLHRRDRSESAVALDERRARRRRRVNDAVVALFALAAACFATAVRQGFQFR